MKNKVQQLKEQGILGMNEKSDKALLPEWYPQVKQPHFKGKGNHSITELENLLNFYVEYSHQQSIIKGELINYIMKDKHS